MYLLIKRFIFEEQGQDFAEYALILGAVGVVAIAVTSCCASPATRLN